VNTPLRSVSSVRNTWAARAPRAVRPTRTVCRGPGRPCGRNAQNGGGRVAHVTAQHETHPMEGATHPDLHYGAPA